MRAQWGNNIGLFRGNRFLVLIAEQQMLQQSNNGRKHFCHY
jgi:hypothetical protein